MRDEQTASMRAPITPSRLEQDERTEPHAQSEGDRSPEPRTTAFAARSCGSCGRPLTGRKERFCSDRCRMRDRRQRERDRLAELLQRLENGLATLRVELLRDASGPGANDHEHIE